MKTATPPATKRGHTEIVRSLRYADPLVARGDVMALSLGDGRIDISKTGLGGSRVEYRGS